MTKGIIIKVLSGLFTVELDDGRVFDCKARGIFRQKRISLVCGDKVVLEQEGDEYVISQCEERKNLLTRPPLANIDCLVFVISTCEPSPNFLVLDKLLAISSFKGINPVLAITKIDKKTSDTICKIYKNTGMKIIDIDNEKGTGATEIMEVLKGKISAFAGNTGVGKSSLLNNIAPELALKTNEISKKLGRGKHTTRHCELFKLDENTYIADTPGFSSLETIKYDVIFKDDLPDCFVEFEQYLGKCKFLGCTHTKEMGCAILSAVEEGKISKSRHNSYIQMFEEAKLLKEWEYK